MMFDVDIIVCSIVIFNASYADTRQIIESYDVFAILLESIEGNHFIDES